MGETEVWRRLKFDNAIRIWVGIPTYLTCAALWAGGAIESLLPITAVILGYALAIFGACTAFFNTRFHRVADYLLSVTDLFAMSVAIYLTGAASSPLYFIYFVPVVIHAFHRDWDLILFSGFGGVVFYGVAIFLALSDRNAAAVADLFARIVFMLLTVAVTCLALSVLRREEQRQLKKTARLRAIAHLGNRLNTACSVEELKAMLPQLSSLISAALGGNPRVAISIPGKPSDQATVPIVVHGEAPLGIIQVDARADEPLSQEDSSFLVFTAHSLALAVKKQGMIQELGRAVEMGTAVAAIYLAADRSRKEAESVLLEGGASLLRADGAALYRCDIGGNRTDVASWWGTFRQPGNDTDQINTGSIEKSLLENAPLTMDDGRAVVVPLSTVGGNPIGAVIFQRSSDQPFSIEEVSLAAAFVCRSAHAVLTNRQPENSKLAPPRLAA